MLKYFEEVADNIRAVENITNIMFSLIEVDDFEFDLLDNYYTQRLVEISFIENWVKTNVGKEIVNNHSKEWKHIFDEIMRKDEIILKKLKSQNLSRKNALKDLHKSKSILIYAK